VGSHPTTRRAISASAQLVMLAIALVSVLTHAWPGLVAVALYGAIGYATGAWITSQQTPNNRPRRRRGDDTR
jgi:hypothetical protein